MECKNNRMTVIVNSYFDVVLIEYYGDDRRSTPKKQEFRMLLLNGFNIFCLEITAFGFEITAFGLAE